MWGKMQDIWECTFLKKFLPEVSACLIICATLTIFCNDAKPSFFFFFLIREIMYTENSWDREAGAKI